MPATPAPAPHCLDREGRSGDAPEAFGPDAFLASLRIRIGTQVGASAWTTVDQARIDRFAVATGDHQFVHVDPVRAAAETPFGGTVAHGYLTLSMVGGFLGDALPAHPALRAVINLGADKVRFLAPVRVDDRIRALFVITSLSGLPGGRAALRVAVTVESEREGRPALTADLSLMLVLADAEHAAARVR